jgi:hypothetical protein
MGDIRTSYSDLVNKKCEEYGWKLSDHVKDVIISLLLTRDGIWSGGDFVRAVLSNDLKDSVNRADSEIIHHLIHIVIARDNFFI